MASQESFNLDGISLEPRFRPSQDAGLIIPTTKRKPRLYADRDFEKLRAVGGGNDARAQYSRAQRERDKNTKEAETRTRNQEEDHPSRKSKPVTQETISQVVAENSSKEHQDKSSSRRAQAQRQEKPPQSSPPPPPKRGKATHHTSQGVAPLISNPPNKPRQEEPDKTARSSTTKPQPKKKRRTAKNKRRTPSPPPPPEVQEPEEGQWDESGIVWTASQAQKEAKNKTSTSKVNTVVNVEELLQGVEPLAEDYEPSPPSSPVNLSPSKPSRSRMRDRVDLPIEQPLAEKSAYSTPTRAPPTASPKKTPHPSSIIARNWRAPDARPPQEDLFLPHSEGEDEEEEKIESPIQRPTTRRSQSHHRLYSLRATMTPPPAGQRLPSATPPAVDPESPHRGLGFDGEVGDIGISDFEEPLPEITPPQTSPRSKKRSKKKSHKKQQAYSRTRPYVYRPPDRTHFSPPPSQFYRDRKRDRKPAKSPPTEISQNPEHDLQPDLGWVDEMPRPQSRTRTRRKRERKERVENFENEVEENEDQEGMHPFTAFQIDGADQGDWAEPAVEQVHPRKQQKLRRPGGAAAFRDQEYHPAPVLKMTEADSYDSVHDEYVQQLRTITRSERTIHSNVKQCRKTIRTKTSRSRPFLHSSVYLGKRMETLKFSDYQREIQTGERVRPFFSNEDLVKAGRRARPEINMKGRLIRNPPYRQTHPQFPPDPLPIVDENGVPDPVSSFPTTSYNLQLRRVSTLGQTCRNRYAIPRLQFTAMEPRRTTVTDSQDVFRFPSTQYSHVPEPAASVTRLEPPMGYLEKRSLRRQAESSSTRRFPVTSSILTEEEQEEQVEEYFPQQVRAHEQLGGGYHTSAEDVTKVQSVDPDQVMEDADKDLQPRADDLPFSPTDLAITSSLCRHIHHPSNYANQEEIQDLPVVPRMLNGLDMSDHLFKTIENIKFLPENSAPSGRGSRLASRERRIKAKATQGPTPGRLNFISNVVEEPEMDQAGIPDKQATISSSDYRGDKMLDENTIMLRSSGPNTADRWQRGSVSEPMRLPEKSRPNPVVTSNRAPSMVFQSARSQPAPSKIRSKSLAPPLKRQRTLGWRVPSDFSAAARQFKPPSTQPQPQLSSFSAPYRSATQIPKNPSRMDFTSDSESGFGLRQREGEESFAFIFPPARQKTPPSDPILSPTQVSRVSKRRLGQSSRIDQWGGSGEWEDVRDFNEDYSVPGPSRWSRSAGGSGRGRGRGSFVSAAELEAATVVA